MQIFRSKKGFEDSLVKLALLVIVILIALYLMYRAFTGTQFNLGLLG